jgi:hypothetical protein
MVETDVEHVLAEIRERVRAAHQASTAASNGVDSSAVARNSARPSTAETLALIDSYLTTTARAWDQFPPLVSNRKGFSASFELWLKRFFRRGTRWYVWEQINFNAAIHHAFRGLLPLLAASEHELEKLRVDAAMRDALQSELKRQLAALQQESDMSNSRNAQVSTQLNALLTELRERDEHLRDEQRVCFKQVTLEMSEAATLEDRSRRKTDTLLAELQRRLDEIEKKS